jgi:hypothetical protein
MPADMSQDVPVARLVKNVSQYIKKHPKDAEGYYTLARVHSIAFSQGFPMGSTSSVTVIRGGAEGKIEKQSIGSTQRAI